MQKNLHIGNRSLQFILWGLEDRDHWGFGYGRWPSGQTLADCRAAGWGNFGFRGFVFGIFEIRYWPQLKKPTAG